MKGGVCKVAVNSLLISEDLDFIKTSKFEISEPRKIHYVTIFNPLLDISIDTAYIVPNPNEFPQENSGEPSLFIVVGNLDEEVMKKSHHYIICVRDTYALGELFKKVQAILLKYKEWEKSLTTLLLADAPLNEFCAASVPIFDNPFTVQTGNFELIGVGETPEISYKYSFREGDSDFLSEEWIASAFKNPDKCFKTRGAFLFDYIQEHKSLLYNIYEGKKYKAQICLDANYRKITKGDFVRMEVLAEYMEKYLKRQVKGVIFSNNKFRTQLASYVLQNMNNQDELMPSLKRHAWAVDANYYCIALVAVDSHFGQANHEYLCRSFENTMKKSIVFSFENVIYAICNNGSEKEIGKNVYDRLEVFAKKYPVKIGVSWCFENFFACRDYFKQARATLKIMVNSAMNQNVCDYSDISLKYVVENGTKKLPMDVIIPAKLKYIIEQDKLNDTEYYKTLRAYLQNHLNVTEAAGSLFLHRSTFKYRMQKIDELMGINYSNLEEIMYLQIIFYLIDECKLAD